jgi:hypothetical protein
MTIKKLTNNENKECAVIYACEKMLIIKKDATIEFKPEIKIDEEGAKYLVIPEMYDNMLKSLGFINEEGSAGV